MSRTKHTQHSTTIAAAPAVVYDLVADVSRWPALFPPTIHAERVSGDDTDERIRLWALANDEVRTWSSHRRLDRAALRVEFRQETPSNPVAAMSGAWCLEPLPGDRTSVVLTHDFSAVGDERNLALIDQAVDTNSTRELEALRLAVEQRLQDRMVLSFSDDVLVDGPVEAVYEFVERSDAWPERLPHVPRLDLREEPDGVQFMVMDTRADDGATHTTESVRICFPGDRIVYKQRKTPPIMSAHVGSWTFRRSGRGTVVSAAHTVVIRPDWREVLGHDTTIDDVRARIRAALSANSATTMRCAKDHVERLAASAD
ncbi:aromatase [Prauserella shujinwangii]|uniref:Aromatase n=1 Tax=Prauserella shujinwangii TaxID=1453103 RepID=A0A2T0M3V1_9PSEU|nr:aromatase/cyclase [Prauserella shujinwangii]PRX51423.1 aromatase [Prauserella shujinwangii]